MDTREIVHRLEESFHDAVVSAADEGAFPFLQVKLEHLKSVMSYCLHDQAMRFDHLECMTAADLGADLLVIYHLRSIAFSHRLNVKTTLPRHKATVASMTCFWRAARSYELEAAEMFGIEFEGHPCPKRLLLPEDWHGNPLRKEYTYPEEYHDLEHRREPLRKEHVRP